MLPSRACVLPILLFQVHNKHRLMLWAVWQRSCRVALIPLPSKATMVSALTLAKIAAQPRSVLFPVHLFCSFSTSLIRYSWCWHCSILQGHHERRHPIDKQGLFIGVDADCWCCCWIWHCRKKRRISNVSYLDNLIIPRETVSSGTTSQETMMVSNIKWIYSNNN